MKNENATFRQRGTWFRFLGLVRDEFIEKLFLCENVDSSLDVATLVLVWVSAIDNGELFNFITISASEHVRQHMTRDGLEIFVLAIG